MPTQTKRAKNARRNTLQRSADHRVTINRLQKVVTAVHNAEQDRLLYCASIRLATRRTPWLQLSPGVMSMWWPYDESPHVVLFRDVPCSLPVRILDWTEDAFTLLSYRGDPEQVATWIDAVFRGVYNCKVGYEVDFDLEDLTR